ncbi:flavodoxin family protein [Demequina sp. SO4-13]|uniref:flavodoxin family protein n=1 Tax=Demequina sp. SO4-13 TaxID=3401027 RepID=UPI003AF98FDD
MDTVVVYESLWGNTAAIAQAIARGLGNGAVALTTDRATPSVVERARLIVVGSPVHAMNLPTDASRASATAKVYGRPGLHADVSHPSIREWLDNVPPGERYCAAFETGIRGPLGHGAARAVIGRLTDLGCVPLDEPHTFTVALVTGSAEPGALLLGGQEEKAMHWGEHLAAALAAQGPEGVHAP